MKKLSLIGAMALMLFSCSKDDSTSKDCNCGKVTGKQTLMSGQQTFSILQVKNYCSGETHPITVEGTQGTIGGEWCTNSGD